MSDLSGYRVNQALGLWSGTEQGQRKDHRRSKNGQEPPSRTNEARTDGSYQRCSPATANDYVSRQVTFGHAWYQNKRERNGRKKQA